MTPTLWLGLVLLQGAPADSLHLSDAVAYARAHRGTVVAATAALDEARAGVSVARALPNPTATYTKSDDTPRQTATIQQSFEWLLTRRSDLGAAHATVGRARADLEGASRDLTREVQSAFVAALASIQVRELATAQLAVADSLERIAGRRLAAGDIPEAEFDRLRLERILATQTLSRARAEESSALLLLARTVGWDPAHPLPPLAGSLADGLDRPTPPSLDVDSLPSVRSAMADSAAATSLARSAAWARLPLPTLEVGRQWDDPTAPGQTLWLFGASIPVPLFSRGGAPSAAAHARAREASANLLEVRLALHQRLADAAVQLEEARTRARLANDSLLPGASLLRTRAARAYALGQTGVLPLLESLRTEREIVAGALNDLLVFQQALADWTSLTGSVE